MSIPTAPHPSVASLKKLHDTTVETVNAIKNLGIDVSTWDPLFVYFLVQKLDAETHNDYIISQKQPRDLPVLQVFLEFLECKFTALETSRRRPGKGRDLSIKWTWICTWNADTQCISIPCARF